MKFSVHEQRFLDGLAVASRAVVNDAASVSRLNMPFQGVEIREAPDGTGGSRLKFTGYASVTDKAYEMNDWLGSYNETVSRGAFEKTLSESPDVAFLLNHGGATMARTKSGTLRLLEDETGLYAEADLDPNRSDVAIVRSAIDGGEMDEMSFAFRVMRQEWDEDYLNRFINEVSLNKGDVSVVNYGANPHTSGFVDLRSKSAQNIPSLLSLVVRREIRDGDGLSADTVSTLTKVLSLVSDADTAVDEVQVVLSDLLGVENPDIAQDAEMEKESAPELTEERGPESPSAEDEKLAEEAVEAPAFVNGQRLRSLEALLIDD